MTKNNIFITGVSSGLGYGLCKKFISKEYNIYAIGKNNNINFQKNQKFFFQKLDLLKVNKIQSTISQLLKKIKFLKFVILNAGILPEIATMGNTTLKTIKNVMQINTWSNKVILDSIFQNKIKVQQVIAISSGASISGAIGWNVYSISKCSLNMLIKLYSQEEKATHFTSLSPGLINSKMQEYIYQYKNTENFSVIHRLQESKRKGMIQNPEIVAEKMLKIFPKLIKIESGSYVDIRNLSL